MNFDTVEIEVATSASEESIRDSDRIPVTLVEKIPIAFDEKRGQILVYSDQAWGFLLRRLEALFPMVADSVAYVESGYQASYEGEHQDIDIGTDWNIVFFPVDGTTFKYAVIEPSSDPPTVTDPHSEFGSITTDSKLPVDGIPLGKGEYATALFEATEEYIRLAEIADPSDNKGPCAVNETLKLYYIGLETMVEHYEEHGTLQNFRFDADSEFIQMFLYQYDINSEDLSRYVIKEGILRDEIMNLSQTENNSISEQYKALLSHSSRRIRSEAAGVLAEYPDDRAKDGLLWTRWTDNPDVVPHAIRALVQIGGEDVREALLELPDFSEKESIRKAAIEGLAEFDDEEVRTTLQTIADNEDESESIHEAACDALTALND
ncbi:HEAT repeat domain-containing protein [Halosimplex halobium]|uniref:HEAT repeat domain-containing protein n=1 Tax=Halosimplex halobium TaxID=3396618 RepID=UPI003F561C08